MQLNLYQCRYAIHEQKVAISNNHNIWSCAHLTKKPIAAHTLSSNFDNCYCIHSFLWRLHFKIKYSCAVICWMGRGGRCSGNLSSGFA